MGQFRAWGERAEDDGVGEEGAKADEEEQQVEAHRHRTQAVQYDCQGREETKGQFKVGDLVCRDIFKVWTGLSSGVKAVWTVCLFYFDLTLSMTVREQRNYKI